VYVLALKMPASVLASKFVHGLKPQFVVRNYVAEEYGLTPNRFARSACDLVSLRATFEQLVVETTVLFQICHGKNRGPFKGPSP